MGVGETAVSAFGGKAILKAARYTSRLAKHADWAKTLSNVDYRLFGRRAWATVRQMRPVVAEYQTRAGAYAAAEVGFAGYNGVTAEDFEDIAWDIAELTPGVGTIISGGRAVATCANAIEGD
jgi:hypothetical protein